MLKELALRAGCRRLGNDDNDTIRRKKEPSDKV